MSTARRYVWKQKDGDYTKPHTKTAMRLAAAQHIVWGKGPYEIRSAHEVVGHKLTKPEAVARVVKLVTTKEVGRTFRVWDAKDHNRFQVRAVLVNIPDPLPVNSTNGNSDADRYYNWVVTRYKSYHPRYAGAYVCKLIFGTNEHSQHSYGNAVDFFFDTSDHQSEVARAAVANATTLSIERVISHAMEWERGVGWHSYGGEYHSHLHVDFYQNIPSWYSCGVRNA